MSAKAVANNDTCLIAWKYDQKIPECLGFALYRVDLVSKTVTPLQSKIGFEGESNPQWQSKSTEQWPIQEFVWADFDVKEDGGSGSYQYEIVPVIKSNGGLIFKKDSKLITNQVVLNQKCGNFMPFFNRGILSTQFLAHQLKKGADGDPSSSDLQSHITKQGDPLRMKLAGDILPALISLLKRAEQEGGQCYCALYELTDDELISSLKKPFVHLILSNANESVKENGKNVVKYDKENHSYRIDLHQHIDIIDRMLSNDRIGHNKFIVYLDKYEKPQAVLTGSTNWTSSGMCGQSNNALIIESPEIAAFYYDYWKRLKDDIITNNLTEEPTKDRTGKGRQGDLIYSTNSHSSSTTLSDKTEAAVWFSPNTKQKTKPTPIPLPDMNNDFSSIVSKENNTEDLTPPDMRDIFMHMKNAKQAILFLVFNPGMPSIIDVAAMCENANPDLFVCGAVTDRTTVVDHTTDLYFGSSKKPLASIPSEAKFKDDGSLVFASKIQDQFTYWSKELLMMAGGHAIIHNKIVVIDPFSDDCVVITGSHNLGYKASYVNDENLVIVKGNRKLAAAYVSHVMDVYRHYRWRFDVLTKGEDKVFSGLKNSDIWQDKFFNTTSLEYKEINFWNS